MKEIQFLKLAACALVVISGSIYLTYFGSKESGNEFEFPMPLILFYTPLFYSQDRRALPEDFNSSYVNCSEQCYFTSNLEFRSRADVVVFNINRGVFKLLPAFDDDFRNPEQVWVMLSWEPPTFWDQETRNYRYIKQMDNVFNWTWTTRMDSDIHFHYGKVSKRENPDWTRKMDQFYERNRTVLAMISRCYTPSNRLRYLTELKLAGLDVDIIGKCRKAYKYNQSKLSLDVLNICRRTKFYSTSSHCEEVISSTYKFYLSFENSLCDDYVTEKFYRPLLLDIVPVVRNGVDMSRYAPNGSYINTRDFKNPRQLADYLKKVGSNPKLYNSFFDWKPYYNAEHTYDKLTYTKNLCDLCAKAREHLISPKQKVYSSMDDWFIKQSHCSRGCKDCI